MLLGILLGSDRRFVYRGITFCAGPFAWPSTTTIIFDSLSVRQNQQNNPTTPRQQRLAAITLTWFGLFRVRSPLLTESQLFSLPVGTEMFHFPTLPLSALCVQTEMMRHDSHRVSPFGNPRIKALLAAPRGFSQPHTTFFGFWCLGIRHLHLIIFLHFFAFKTKMLAFTV